MYCIDTLERLNDEALRKAQEAVEQGGEDAPTCDYCQKPATRVFPTFNPADAVRNKKVEGAYGLVHVCEDCDEKGIWTEDNFVCDGCGEVFITNHSWDSLACTLEDGVYCHSCAAERIVDEGGVPLVNLLAQLRNGKTEGWKRVNGLPGREVLWEGEFSEWSDFPGHTSLKTVADEVEKAATEAGLDTGDSVFPLVTQTYQFSVVLTVYR